jgi:biopolymer transport protein ExbD
MNIDFERRNKPTRALTLIPLVDVLLVLIIYFLVSGSLRPIEILAVEPPFAQSGEELNQGQLVVVLGKHDEILINDELGTMQDILPKISAELKRDKNRVITIKADNRMNATRLIEVMNLIRDAGGEHLTLATQTP